MNVLENAISHDELCLLKQWNDTQKLYPEITLAELLDQQALSTPDAIAIIFAGQTVTYKVLHQRANQWARYLQTQGIGCNSIVAVYLPRCVELIITILAIIKAGGIYLPLDLKEPPARIKKILKDSGALNCITEEKLLETTFLSAFTPKIFLIETINQQAIQYSPDFLPYLNKPHDGSYVIYTSGTTGTPKGVMNIQQGTVNQLSWLQDYFSLTQDDRFLLKTSLGFDASLWEIFWPLSCGAKLVLAGAECDTSIQIFIAEMIKYQITVIYLTPTQLSTILQSDNTISSVVLRFIISGGESMTPAILRDVSQILPSVQVYNLYGMTEASIAVSYFDCTNFLTSSATVPIGKPIANTSFYVVDSDMVCVPLGEVGELVIAGLGLAAGYLHQPELTQEKFTTLYSYENQLIRVYRTGDRVRWLADGNLEFLGREDGQVNIRGQRVELAEIEAILCQHAAIQQALVTTKTAPSGQDTLVSYSVKHRTSIQPTESELVQHVLNYLPSYMLPSQWLWLEQLPVNAVGKVDKKLLPEPDWRLVQQKTLEPSSLREQQLTALWEAVLQTFPIGPHDNFYAVGGSSLSAMVIASRAEKLGIYFHSQWLMQYPTIYRLLQHIDSMQHRVIQRNNKTTTTLVASACHAAGLNPENIAAIYPMTPMQLGMLIHISKNPHIGMYLDQIRLEIIGDLNTVVFKQAWETLLKRHENLRTGFYLTEFDTPQQVVFKACPLRYTFIDLTSLAKDEQQRILNEYSEAVIKRGFPYKVPPLWEINLFQLGDNRYRFYYTDQHAMSDGITQGNLFKELFQLYNAYSDNRTINLSAPLPFSDYVEWLSQQDQVVAKQYWQKRLRSVEAPTLLGIDKAALGEHHEREASYQQQNFTLSKEKRQRLMAFAQQHKVTLNTLIQATWAILLARYSREQPIVYGLIESGRSIDLKGIEQRVGAFSLSFPMVVEMDTKTSVDELLQVLQQQVIMSTEYSYYSLSDMQKQSVIPGQTPLFHYAITFPDYTVEQIDFGANNFGNSLVSEKTAQFSQSHFVLTAVVVLTEQIKINVNYNDAHFNFDAIEQLLQHWQILLDGIVNCGAQSAIHLEMFTVKEKQHLLCQAKSFNHSSPLEKTVVQLFEEKVRENPDSIALIFNDAQMTYRELNERSNQLACYLRKQGVKAEAKVVVYLSKNFDLITSLLAILKAGGTYVPVDAFLAPSRVNFIVADCAADIVISQKCMLSTGGQDSAFHEEKVLYIDELEDTLQSYPSINLVGTHHLNDAAYIIYTSGTTGQPKGVVVEHKSLSHLFFSAKHKFDFTEKDVWSFFHSISFDFSLWEILGALLNGAKLVIFPQYEVWDFQAYYNLLLKYEVTILNQTPSVFYELTRIAKENLKTKIRKLEFLRYVVLGGDNIHLEYLNDWVAIYGSEIPRLVNMYGITETTIHVTYQQLKWPDCLEHVFTPIGSALRGIDTYVVDPYLQILPINVPGELLISGEALARGYLNQPELTQEKFITNPFSENKKSYAYRTGDLVRRLPDGQLEYMGRIDEQVNLRGCRIELGEIECALLRFPGVDAAKVMPETRNVAGRAEVILIAFLFTKAKVGDNRADNKKIQKRISLLREHLMTCLPCYMIPSDFFWLEEWPMTINGKLNTSALSDLSNQLRNNQAKDAVIFRTKLEIDLLSIFESTLGVGGLSITDDFFACGGHSLLLASLLIKIRNCLKVKLEPGIILKAPTVEKLATIIQSIRLSAKKTVAV